MLFYIPKDVVFAEILFFCNIFGFPAVNWAPKRTKTLKVLVRSISAKFQDFEEFFKQCVCLNRQILVKILQERAIIEERRAKKPKKGPFHGC